MRPIKLYHPVNRRAISRGTSLMEVIAGLTLTTLLMVPMLGLLRASHQIWRQFETGHGSIAVRQATIQEVQRRLDGATRVLAANGTQIRFVARGGDNQRIYLNGSRVFWQHAGVNELLADGVSGLRFRRLAQGATAALGELYEIRVQNLRGSNVADTTSLATAWIRPSI